MFYLEQLQTNFLVFAFLSGLFLVCARSLPRRKPPGPRGIPIFGNLFQLSKAKVWKVFEEWGKEYGNYIV